MNLKDLTIKNFRCIENLTFKIEDVDNSFTYTLLGINESGKSSFLRAIALIDNEVASYPEDFFNDQQVIELVMKYKVSEQELKDIKNELSEKYALDKTIVQEVEITEVEIQVMFSPSPTVEKEVFVSVSCKKELFGNFTEIENGAVVKKGKEQQEMEGFDLKDFLENNFNNYLWDLAHKIVFWKSAPEYLLLDEIDLTTFSANPEKISIPLYNCFCLAGVESIKKEVDKLTTSVARQNLTDLLSENVTNHINKVWPEHQISIKFNINNNKLTFLVEDREVKFKVKTTGQRSDGFRQFISFLLTLSAENLNDRLSNSILLLDEPETHLHPTAQLNLLEELIKLSRNKNNNIVFFATHSNYMIDKNQIDRCYKVIKKKNHTTVFHKIERIQSTYAEVNYEVFGISTTDYHNELYGFLEVEERAKINSLAKNKEWYNEKKKAKEDVSLATYIRHSIHHPENTSNKKFTEVDLKKSIQILRELKYGKE